MDKQLHEPAVIAGNSFAIIRGKLRDMGLAVEPATAPLVERVIHCTADFDFAHITRFSAQAVEGGVGALQNGCAVVTDVHMVRVGISARRLSALGGSAHCFVADDEAQRRSAADRITRSAAGMRLAAERGLLTGAIVAIGNAPTALYEVIDLMASRRIRPALVIGVPVGFVNTAESKTALEACTSTEWIVTAGNKGGSTVAAAIVNALLRIAQGVASEDVD
ncbi:MAG: precorrin-8X methylmutase [Chloroflexi bacterium]|nr:precorrin-8X methylmutase [Chloroflexota bacterium]MCL5274571.1 precorrin-8X methylmutase [Chloroflexota bacterium]